MRRPRYILALDQGTSSSRAVIFDEWAEPIATVKRPTTQSYPEPGWVIQDAEGIWKTTLATSLDAMARAGIGAREMAAIGIANQTESLVVWSRTTGAPATPVIGWQSRQSQRHLDALIDRGMAATYQHLTGPVPDPCFRALKLAWLFTTPRIFANEPKWASS